MSKSLIGKSLSGIVWTLLDVIVNKLLFFVVSIWIAKIIGPEQMGLIGMIAIFITIGNSLVDSGLSVSLIRTPEIEEKDKSTIFISNVAISIFIYLIFFLLAPLVAKFYQQPLLTSIIRIYTLIFVITAFRAVQVALNFRALNFRANTIFAIPGGIICCIVGIVLAYQGYGVWSVVYMYLVQQFIFTILLWINSKWKVNFVFSKESLKKHFNFGYKLTLSGVLNTTCNNINNILIGKFYPLSFSGFYERAYTLNQYPSTVFTAVISKVSLPILSKIQEDKEKVVGILQVLMRNVFLLMAFVMTLMIVFANELVYNVLGEEWIKIVPYLQIISLASVFTPLHMFNVNILQIYGRSDFFLKAEFYKKFFQIVCILVLFKFGIYWLVSSLIFLSIFELYINALYVGKIIPFGFLKQMKNHFLYFLAFLLICGGAFYIKDYFGNNTQFIDSQDIFVFLGIAFSYVLIVLFFEKNRLLNLLKTIKR